MKITKRRLVITIVLLIYIFQDVMDDAGVRFLTYLDEIFTLLVFALALFAVSRKRIKTLDSIFIIVLLSYYIVGWWCHFLNGSQPHNIAFSSSLLSIKFFLLFWGTKICLSSYQQVQIIWNDVYKSSSFIIVFMSIFVLITKALQLSVFFWPWDLCAKSVFMMTIIIANWQKHKQKHNLFLLALCIIMLLSTSKAKAFAAIALTIVIIYWIIKKSKKIRIYHLVLAAVVAVIAGWKKIYYYYVNGYGRYARSVLTLTGFKISKDKFPLGMGWGEFASYYSSVNYSKVYYQYGLDTHGEVGAGKKAFLMDTYWPSVLGETGWLGAVIILLLLFILFIMIQRLYKRNKYYYAAGMIGILYLMVTTFEESGFMQPVLMCFACSLAYLISTKEIIRKSDTEYMERKRTK